MRICVFGAGALGGCLAVGLAAAGAEVSLLARGPHLAAIRARGLTLRTADGERTAKVTAAENPEELGTQDVVVVALAARSAPATAKRMTSLFDDETTVVTAVGGVPWWYFHAVGGPFDGTRIEAADPGGVQWDTIGPQRVIGCVPSLVAAVDAPGVVRLVEGRRIAIGEPSGEKTARATALAEVFRAGGFNAKVKARIRDEVWAKLWDSLAMDPVAALTGAVVEEICRFPASRGLVRTMMLEGQAIGEALGARFAGDVDKRIAAAEAGGADRASVLQERDRSRAMEADALVSAVQELGRLTEVPTPTIDAVLALLKLRGFKAGVYEDAF